MNDLRRLHPGYPAIQPILPEMRAEVHRGDSGEADAEAGKGGMAAEGAGGLEKPRPCGRCATCACGEKA